MVGGYFWAEQVVNCVFDGRAGVKRQRASVLALRRRDDFQRLAFGMAAG